MSVLLITVASAVRPLLICNMHLFATFASCFFLAVFLSIPSNADSSPPIEETQIAVGEFLENAPALAASGDSIVAVWFQDIHLAWVGWALSSDGAMTWTVGGSLPTIVENREAAWLHPTICYGGNGQFFAASIYASSLQGGFAISVYRGEHDGSEFTWKTPTFAAPFARELFVDPYDTPHLGCDPERSVLYLVFARARCTTEPVLDFDSEIQFVRSLDQGLTWSEPMVLSGPEANGARCAVGPEGEVYVVWKDYGAQAILGRKSTDFGQSFGETFSIAAIEDNAASGPPGHEPFPNRRNPLQPFAGRYSSDFPSLAVDRSGTMTRGTLYVTWAEKLTAIRGELTRTVPEREPNDSLAQAMPVQFGEEVLGITTSGDEPVEHVDDDYFVFEGEAGQTVELQVELTSISPFPGPSFWGLGPTRLLCGTDLENPIELAVADWADPRLEPSPPIVFTLPTSGKYFFRILGGHLFKFFYRLQLRELLPAAGSAALDHRDVVLVRSSDGGRSWSPKQRVNDDLPQFDNSMPEVVVDEFGWVHVAWYDRRDDGICGAGTRVYGTYSPNGARSFLPSRPLSTAPSSWQFHSLSRFSNVGDRLALSASGNRVYSAWMDTRLGGADIFASTSRFRSGHHRRIPAPFKPAARIDPQELSIEDITSYRDLGTVQLRLNSSEHGHLVVRIYDIHGRECAVLFEGSASAGSRVLTWDGTTRNGTAAPNGIYFLRVQKGGAIPITRKVLLLR